MEDDLPDTTAHIKPPFIPNPPHFDHAGLFIDSAACYCGDRQSLTPPPPGA